jgi:hypothetical protein
MAASASPRNAVVAAWSMSIRSMWVSEGTPRGYDARRSDPERAARWRAQ